MKIERRFTRWMSVFLATLLLLPGGVLAQSSGEAKAPGKPFSQEQLEQLLAPVALYPDSLLTQLLMASTYPLEVVKANNWVKQNKDLKGDALTKALEKQTWDPSVKSLVNFPTVLQMMSDKVDWTQKLGDAFLAQQKDVLNTVQKLRKKAYETGNLKSTKEQKVAVDNTTKIIIIEPASPQIVYVPTYDPVVVYGVWAYPAYPPYPVYPPPPAGAFFVGVAVGVAWGYAWGHSNWHGGDVDIDINRNTNINTNIDRGNTRNSNQGGAHPARENGSMTQATGRALPTGTTRRQSSMARNPHRRPAMHVGTGGPGRAAPKAGSTDRGGSAGTRDAGSYDRGGNQGAFGGSGNSSFDQSASQRGQTSRGDGGGEGGGRGGGGRGGRR